MTDAVNEIDREKEFDAYCKVLNSSTTTPTLKLFAKTKTCALRKQVNVIFYLNNKNKF